MLNAESSLISKNFNVTEAFGDAEQLVDEFRMHWQSATADSNLTLHGFRRFKTMHLLNLRFLENEISQLDHQIYQAGLNLNLNISLNDRLGLKHSKWDKNVPKILETITKTLSCGTGIFFKDMVRVLVDYRK